MAFWKRDKKVEALGAPLAGEVIACEAVNDPAFRENLLGRGVAIQPSSGRVVAPCDATVDTMFETGHAVSLRTKCGAQLLIHVGIDTVKLKGKHFTAHVSSGERVKKAQLLIEFDKEAIAGEGYDTVVPFVVCNSDEFALFETVFGKQTAEGETVIRLEK